MQVYDGHPVFDNNVIIDNVATRRGAGIYAVSGNLGMSTTLHLRHTTIARNSGGATGDGSGFTLDQVAFGAPTSAVFTNTIFAANTVGLIVTEGNTATLTGTLWDANTAQTGGAGAINRAADYAGDPAFKPDGYHLTHLSAARNRGDDAGVAVDIDGDPRPATDAYDLGADEYLPTVFMPIVIRG